MTSSVTGRNRRLGHSAHLMRGFSQTARTNAYHNALAYPPPGGPGLRVKLEWLKRKPLYWPKVMGGGSVLHPTSGVQYELTEQKAVDVSLAFHLMLSYSNRKWRKLFFGAGDGDFKTPIQYLVEFENVDLFLIGTMNTISEELGLTREISSELTRSRINSRDPRLRRESDLFRNKASMGRALNR
jgi:hypothetical protein